MCVVWVVPGGICCGYWVYLPLLGRAVAFFVAAGCAYLAGCVAGPVGAVAGWVCGGSVDVGGCVLMIV